MATDQVFYVDPPKFEGEKDRLTVMLSIHHEHSEDVPTSVQPRFSTILENIEQPYQRRMSIGEEWQRLDLGWIGSPGWICLENRAGQNLKANPTEEEAAAIVAKNLLVCIGDAGADENSLFAKPGKFLVFETDNARRVWVRCASGSTPIQLTIFPG